MTRRTAPKKKTVTVRIGPGLIGFAIAAAAMRRAKLEEEKNKYAEAHGGHRVPRRKKGPDNGNQRTGR